ncbi:response regulator [Streptomyces sp. NPDC059474]|uniref:response regulator n=1 Tax=Streptomyces sp. NPDC059474 TaxID=3346846 RepID=UPI0036A931F0
MPWPRYRWRPPVPEQISVLVVDDEPITRAGLSAILHSQADLTVAGTAGDGEEAAGACARLRPDVLLLDIRMPRRDGLWALAELGRRGSWGRAGSEGRRRQQGSGRRLGLHHAGPAPSHRERHPCPVTRPPAGQRLHQPHRRR